MIRGITGGHLFGNGNKWTAVEVVEQLNVKTVWMARQSKLFGMLWIRGKWGLTPISPQLVPRKSDSQRSSDGYF